MDKALRKAARPGETEKPNRETKALSWTRGVEIQQNLISQCWNSAVPATLLLEVAGGPRCISSGLSAATVTVIKKGK